MNSSAVKTGPVFMPGIDIHDPLAAYWLHQATVRLRREIAWLWQEQGLLPGNPGLPHLRDKLAETLNQKRFYEKKREFYQQDPTAAYLSQQLAGTPPEPPAEAKQGSFSWLSATLQLSNLEAFTLALAMLPVADSSAGSVIAACSNDANRAQPGLSLVQRLWDSAGEVMALADPSHRLYQHGLLQSAPDAAVAWERPLTMAPLVAQQLLQPAGPAIPEPVGMDDSEDWETHSMLETIALAASRIRSQSGRTLYVPILGNRGSLASELAQRLGQRVGRPVMPVGAETKNAAQLRAWTVLAWLKGCDLFLDAEQVAMLLAERPSLEPEQMPMLQAGVALYFHITERRQIAKLPASRLLPVLEAPRLDFRQRRSAWRRGLGERADNLDALVAECSRRFRFQKKTIESLCLALRQHPGPLSGEQLFAACRAEAETDMGELAQPVVPRFQSETIILPAKQAAQFDEILRAMQSLTEVHYAWGTEKAWNESGIAVLFSGPPGTGKTMAAEILASRLDLPMYRIDLSQVASKYIGETEKNLKRLFDAADVCDSILFFDEADALFGRRTEVRDAHDRYANLEISYLLERMERFKGLAILATNRKKDLDEAFLRRLRYIMDFPLPGEAERRKIWRQVIPAKADAASLDLDFLARQFSLAGGHIRSIVFNACLQAAGRNPGAYRLDMETVLIALKREFEKMNRSLSLEQFGPYAHMLESQEAGHVQV